LQWPWLPAPTSAGSPHHTLNWGMLLLI
jgi:hypothetical protein